MDKVKIVDSLKLYPGIENINEALLVDIAGDALLDVANYINKEVSLIPDELESVVKRIALANINRIGNEGVMSESISGVNRSFLDDLSKADIRLLKKKRELPVGFID